MTTLAAIRLPVVAALSALTGFALWQLLAFSRAGTFEYPLDDVYIHLAMAEGIAGGTYGINPGEPASAASSILYPVLLLPFAGGEGQRYLPLLWNALALVALAWLFGRQVARANLSPAQGIFVALVAPFALNMPNVAALGMEHTLHAFCTLVLLSAFWSFLETGQISRSLVVAAVLGPLLRYEALALSLLVAGFLMLRGSKLAGLGLGAAVLLGPALFSAFLLSQGLDPLPSSVLAKVGGHQGDFDPLSRLITNGLEPAAAIAYIAFLLLTTALLTSGRRISSDRRLLLLTVWLAAAAHLAVGQVGWLNRYEHYVIVMIGAAMIVALPTMTPRFKGVLVITSLTFAVWYGLVNVQIFSWNPRAIHLQQAEMARFSETLQDEAVAANDIGRLAWRHEAYVFDLWGLASADARRARTAGSGTPAQGWAAGLIAAKGVRYAMIYDSWIGKGVGADWRKVADLTMENPRGALGGFTVSIYATDPSFETSLRAAIQEFRPRLTPGAVLTETK